MAPTCICGPRRSDETTVAMALPMPSLNRMTKNQLRTQYKEVRQKFWSALSQPEQDHIAIQLATQALNYLSSLDLSDKTVGIYSATPQEAPTQDLITLLHQSGYKVLLPKISQNHGMDFCLYNPGDPLMSNDYGVLEPDSQTLQTPRVLIIPGIAFTLEGNRLGYGKGYYDRYLAKQNRQGHFPYKIGYGFDCQIAQALPTDLHDQIMDCIITQTRVSNVTPKA